MSNQKQARLSKLRQAIAKNRSLHVRAAAEMLKVSEMTVRRDIRENPDIFNYLGGYIVALDQARRPYDLDDAADINQQAKLEACQNGLGFINAGDTIFVDCGTTLLHLVDLLPENMPLTLICYALNTADRALRKPDVKLILLGGEYHTKTASFAPLKHDNMFEALAINTAFLSAAGLDEKLGATCSSFHEASQKRRAMRRAQKNVLLIDDSKIGKTSAAKFAQAKDFDFIITQTGAI